MNYTFFAISLGAFALTVLLLWCVNESQEKRYRQRLVPLLAIITGVGGVCIYWFFPINTIHTINSVFLQFVYHVLNAFEIITGFEVDVDFSGAPKYAILLFNLSILLFLLLIKAIHFCIGFYIRLIFSWFESFPRIMSVYYKGRSVVLFFSPFQMEEGRKVYLIDSWVYPGKYFRVFSLLYFLSLILYLLCLSSNPECFVEYKFLDLPVISFLFFLETGWYLSGGSKVDGSENKREDNTLSDKNTLRKLWHVYAEICPERMLSGCKKIQYTQTSLPENTSNIRKESSNQSDLLLDIIESNLSSNQKCGLSENQKAAIRFALEGKDVHLMEPVFCEASAIVFSVLQRDYLLGGTILVLLPWDIDSNGMREVEQWLTSGFSTVYFDSLTVTIGQNGRFADNSVVMATPSELLCAANADEWLKSLKRVVVVDTSQVFFSNIFQAEECCTLLEDKCKLSPDYLLLSTADHRDLEGSLRDFLGVEPKEVVLHKNREHLRHAYHIWQAEGEPTFQEHVLQNNRGIPYGNIIPLLVPAVKHGVGRVEFFGVNKRLFNENLEEFEQEQELLNITLTEIAQPAFFASVKQCRPYGLVVGRDSLCNLVETVKKGLHFCEVETLLLAVSPMYMLRDYLTDSIEYFIQSDSLTSYLLSPRKLKTKYTIGMALYARLKNGFISEEIIKNRYLNQIPGAIKSSISVKKRLADLFYDLFEEDFLQLDLLHEEKYYHYNDQTQPFSFVELSKFRLSKVVDKRTFVTSHRYYSLQDSSGKILGKVHSDQVYQNYLVGQVHGIAGEPYKVEQIDEEVGVVRLVHSAGTCISENLHVKTITLLPKGNFQRYETSSNDVGDGEISGRIFFGECEFESRVDGFHSYVGGVQNSRYTPLKKAVVKRYKYGRFVQMSFTLSEQSSISVEGVAETLALLLQEIMPTIFPETYRSLCVSCPGVIDSRARKNDWAEKGLPCDLLPVLEGLENEQTSSDKGFSLYIFEDAEFDLGMIKTVTDQWKILFAILEDYLHWLKDDNSTMSIERKEKFLCFGRESIHTQLKLSAVRKILEYLLRNESDTLKKIRNRSAFGLRN